MVLIYNMAGIKKRKTEEQKTKHYYSTIKKRNKWRGKDKDKYVKYTRSKKEKEKDWYYHSFLGYTLKNPKKYYGEKGMEKYKKMIMNKKGGYEVLKKLKLI